MHPKFWKLIFLIAIQFLILPSFGQDKKMGTISGTVKDSRSKLPLSEAVVTLSSPALTGKKIALTDSTGLYHVANLPAGIYTITFEMEGYYTFVQENILLQEGMTMGVSFQMAKDRTAKNKDD